MQPKIERLYPFLWNSPSVWLGPILRFEGFLNVKSSGFKNIAGTLWFASGFSLLASGPLSPWKFLLTPACHNPTHLFTLLCVRRPGVSGEQNK